MVGLAVAEAALVAGEEALVEAPEVAHPTVAVVGLRTAVVEGPPSVPQHPTHPQHPHTHPPQPQGVVRGDAPDPGLAHHVAVAVEAAPALPGATGAAAPTTDVTGDVAALATSVSTLASLLGSGHFRKQNNARQSCIPPAVCHLTAVW